MDKEGKRGYHKNLIPYRVHMKSGTQWHKFVILAFLTGDPSSLEYSDRKKKGIAQLGTV